MKVMRSLGVLIMSMGLVASCYAAGQARQFVPTNDSDVIETLAPRILSMPRKAASTEVKKLSVKAAAEAAQRAISLSRETGDPRYLGQAQALLSPWWDKSDAPLVIAVLQATIQQSRHEFDMAKMLLTTRLNSAPNKGLVQGTVDNAARSQGWLTLATIERVSGQYASSLAACARVSESDPVALQLYATACELETRSLMGQYDFARKEFAALILQTHSASLKSWLWSLSAENEERAGRDEASLKAYQNGLKLQEDTYSALAASDLLLRKNQAAAALKILENQPASDAVIIRRAFAKKMLGDTDWKVLLTEVRDRFKAMDLRGDDSRTHAREQALAHLWLEEDGVKALAAAKLNLTLQKEPIDWWIAVQSAQLLKDQSAIATLRKEWQVIGLKDARLAQQLP
jgi:tetratricopeptide (TPR) repeat protein